MDNVCWACESDAPIVYIDVLDMPWCEDCFERIYMKDYRSEHE